MKNEGRGVKLEKKYGLQLVALGFEHEHERWSLRSRLLDCAVNMPPGCQQVFFQPLASQA